MSQGIGVVGLYVRDQDEAIEFYVDKLGFPCSYRCSQRRLSLVTCH
ncbi:VOC family protein [Nitrosomonas sp.]